MPVSPAVRGVRHGARHDHHQPAPSPPAASPPCTFSGRLDAEWDHLPDRPHRPGQGPNMGRGDGRADGSRPDHRRHPAGCVACRLRRTAILLRLVELAGAHDELAGRLLIQRLLPGLISRRSPTATCTRTSTWSNSSWPAPGWPCTRSTPTDATATWPRSLISDAVYQTFRKPLRRKSTSDELRSPHRFDWMVDEHLRVSAFRGTGRGGPRCSPGRCGERGHRAHPSARSDRLTAARGARARRHRPDRPQPPRPAPSSTSVRRSTRRVMSPLVAVRMVPGTSVVRVVG